MQWMNKHQVALYLVALGLGAGVSFIAGVRADAINILILPSLAALLTATFITLPLSEPLPKAEFSSFLVLLFGVNFVLAPLIIWGLLTVFTPSSDAITFTVALILLAPCIDYVVVFSGLAGADARKMLAATPALLLGQAVLVPVWLYIFSILGLWDSLPWTLRALEESVPSIAVALSAVVIPLVCAWGLQKIAELKWRGAQSTHRIAAQLADALMVPLMMLVLSVSVAANLHAVTADNSLIYPALVYLLFAGIMWMAGTVYARWLGRVHPVDHRRAVVFSGVTRNALVMMPVALALTSTLDDAALAAKIPLVIVTQTLVELCVMVIMVRVYRAPK